MYASVAGGKKRTVPERFTMTTVGVLWLGAV